MNCQELRDQLHPYMDGELDSASMLEIKRALDDCPDCQAELDELQAVQLMARAAFEGPVDAVDLSGVVGNVMDRLASEGALREAPQSLEREAPGLGAWFKALFTFEQPLLSLAAAAIALLVIGAVAFTATSNDETAAGPAIATPTPEKPKTESVAEVPKAASPFGKRPGLETKTGRHAAFVEHVEAAKGRVVVDTNTEDPSKPMVVWHHVDEGIALPTDGDGVGQEL